MAFLRRAMSFGQSRGAPSSQAELHPFPRYQSIANLTWNQCFSMNREQITNVFLRGLITTDIGGIAYMAWVMLQQPTGAASSTVILTTLLRDATLSGGKKADPLRWPRVDVLDPGPENRCNLPLGSVHWSPSKGTIPLHLYCYTVCDLLGACMAEAAHRLPTSPDFKARTKRSYYARLVALYSHWCTRLMGDRRPMKVSLAVFQDLIILGSCIPDVPQIQAAKGFIRLARLQDLKKRGRLENGKRQVLDLQKVQATLWDYGNCAETWCFALLSTLPEAVMPKAFGIAVNTPEVGVTNGYHAYNEQWERTRGRYAPLCVNCEKLMKQIARWGKPGDKVVENFSVWKWEGLQ